jgi:DNA-binding IclR family transcriptional regulator
MRALTRPAKDPLDLTPWISLQSWLEHAERRVVIPYSAELAERIPPVAVRLRRDFGQLLALIQAHALLHQATRERDAAGRILATLEDYAVVRELVVDVIAEGLEATVAPSVRETVKAVETLLGEGRSEATIVDIARQLALDKSAASRRIARAVQLGLLRNLEDRKGRPARLCLGDPLPPERSVLPSVAALHGCSVAREV